MYQIPKLLKRPNKQNLTFNKDQVDKFFKVTANLQQQQEQQQQEQQQQQQQQQRMIDPLPIQSQQSLSKQIIVLNTNISRISQNMTDRKEIKVEDQSKDNTDQIMQQIQRLETSKEQLKDDEFDTEQYLKQLGQEDDSNLQEQVVKKKEYQPRNYLEEFFDQKGIIQKQIDRKKKMLEAMNYEIPKLDKEIDQLINQFDDYKEEADYNEFKVKQIEDLANQMSLKDKLEKLEGDLGLALNLEKKQEYMIEPDDTDPNDKLQLMYEDNKNIIEEYDRLKAQILKQMETKDLKEEEIHMLQQFDKRQERDTKYHDEIKKRINNIKDETVKLKLNKELQKVSKSAQQRTELMKRGLLFKEKEEEKKQIKKQNQQQGLNKAQQIGYGKNKVTIKNI